VKPLVKDNIQICRLVLMTGLAMMCLVFNSVAQTTVDTISHSVLQQNITLHRQNSTLYQILNQISRQTGHYFIYDSQIINSNQKVRINKTEMQLDEFLKEVLKDSLLTFRIIENHILIHRNDSVQAIDEEEDKMEPLPEYLIVKGQVLDYESGSPLAYASVGIPSMGLGMPSNTDGFFRFKLNRELANDSLRISYMGYKTRYIPVQLMLGSTIEIRLQPDYISMQEVIIRYYDPIDILRQAFSRREQNFSSKPAYLIAFYREGVQHSDRYISYSEAVFRIFKSSYHDEFSQDQAMVLKSRHFANMDQTDTLLVKLKAGVKSSLDLDIMKNLPDFLDPEYFFYFNFHGADLVNLDSRSVYAIDFQQKSHVNEALYMGTVYVDKEHMAVVKAEFKLHPDYLGKITDNFVLKKGRRTSASLQNVSYQVSYRLHDGTWYLSHVRGDIGLRIRNRGKLFGKNYNIFLELAVNSIETENVSRFKRREAFQTNKIFAEQDFQYDYDFWGAFNSIAPEQHIHDAWMQIQSKVEMMITDH
jgi:hypothetical protein